MLRHTVKKVSFLAGLFCILSAAAAFGQEATAPIPAAMTPDQLSAAMLQKWGNLQDFQADMTVGMQMMGKMQKVAAKVWQKPPLVRLEATMPADLMPQQAKATAPAKLLMVFDGKIMWATLPMAGTVFVTKTDFASLEGKIKSAPFSKPPYNLPAVSYTLSEKTRNDTDYYFLETHDATGFIQKSGIASVGVNLPVSMPYQSVGIWVNKATLFPDLFEFYVQGDTPGMSLEFRNVKTNQGFSPDLFVFKVPSGAQVIDMTQTVKAAAEKAGK